MDSGPANRRFAQDIGVKFPLLSDWKRDVTKLYGLYNATTGYGTRGTFVIDKEGIVQHVETGRSAIDPTGAFEVCERITKRPAK